MKIEEKILAANYILSELDLKDLLIIVEALKKVRRKYEQEMYFNRRTINDLSSWQQEEIIQAEKLLEEIKKQVKIIL